MTVALVGAGPGDPGLIARRAAELLAGAHLVVHDPLPDARVLDLAPSEAERLEVGTDLAADDVADLLLAAAREGRSAVRLMVGDPLSDPIAPPEALAMAAAGLPFEVVPGVSRVAGAAAFAGVPLTWPGLSTSWTVVRDRNELELVGAVSGTLVVTADAAPAAEVAATLMAAGFAPGTPVVAVERASLASQATLRTDVAGLAAADVGPGAVVIVGAVAGLDLGWFEHLPLFGRRVIVTRARDQAGALGDRLRRLGAEVVELPVIEIGDPADGGEALRAAADQAGRYDWVVFTSVNGVERFFPLLRDVRALGGASVAAIGTGTAEALARWHVAADLVPERFVAESLLEAFPPPPPQPATGRVLLPRAAVAREVLPDGLRAAGWAVDVVEAYRTAPTAPGEAALGAARSSDAITFTSSSTVTAYLELAGPHGVPPIVACIGPVTAATAREAGLTVDVEADVHTIDGLVDALVAALPGP